MLSRYFSLVLMLSLFFTSALAAQTIHFIDKNGDPTSEVLKGGLAQIRITSSTDNTNSVAIETLTGAITSLYGGDYRDVDFHETGIDTGVFEASVQLGSSWISGLHTTHSGSPDYFHDQVTASYSSFTITATVHHAAILLLDEFGQVATSYAVGETVHIRVLNATTEPEVVDQLTAQVETLGSGDVETVQLTETDGSSGVFEGSIAAALSSTSGDGQIDTSIGETVRATTFSGPITETTVDAAISGPQIYLLDAAGQPTSTYLAGSIAYLRVIDALAGTGPGTVDSVHAVMSSLFTGDFESVLLTETGAATGYYEGSIQLSLAAISSPDGVLQTSELGGPPHQFDTLTAEFDHEGISITQATAMTTDPIVAFVDVNGNDVNTYNSGSTLYVMVEDPVWNQGPSWIDTIEVEIIATSGDEEWILAAETGVDTGIFTGTLPLDPGPVTTYDDIVQAGLGDTVEAHHFTYFGYTMSTDQVLIQEPVVVTFIDLLGQPITVSAQETDVHPWVQDNSRNDPAMVDSISVVLNSPTSDLETLILTESGIDTGIFTGSIMVSEFSSYLPEDGRLDALGNQTISFSYSDSGTTSSADLSLMQNYAPYAIDDSASAPIDGSVDIAVLTNDHDTEPGLLNVLAATQGTNGTTAVNGDQTVTYTPNPGFSGTDTFTYVMADSEGGQAAATVTVTLQSAPVVLISYPTDGEILDALPDEGFYFAATATDPEDGDLSASINWTSDLDGPLGTGPYAAPASLSLGIHTITASVTDSAGASSSASIMVTINGTPNVVITMPSSSPVTDIDLVTFAATAIDAEDGDLSAGLTWDSDVDGALATGASFATAALSVGHHLITASVSDSLGITGSASISILVEINPPPTVTVTAPADGSVHIAGTSVTFAGTAYDGGEEGDGDLTANLSWTSDIDGALGASGSFTTSALSVGTHTITAAVTDSQGASGSASITVTVNANQAPTAAITAPANGAASTETDPITFTGTASDSEDGDLTASLSWTSSINGVIGSGGSFTTSALSVGTHTITAAVSDSQSVPASASITVTVNANTAPSVTILTPADGEDVTIGDAVNLSGSAFDAQDGDLSAALTWSSSLDGVLGTGSSVATSALSLGNHTLTASVNDSHGVTGLAAVTILVRPLPVEVTFTSVAVEDGWARESSENSDVGGKVDDDGGSSSALRVGDHKKDRQYKGLVSFVTSSIPDGAEIQSVSLRLVRGKVSGTNPFTTHGNCWVDVHSGGFNGSTGLENADFEASATATQVASMSNPLANNDVSEGLFDAAGMLAIDKLGTTQIRLYFELDDIDDGGNDYVGFYSSENTNTGRHPQLVVTYQE